MMDEISGVVDVKIVRPSPSWDEQLAMDHPYRPSHIHLCDALGNSIAQAGDHGGVVQL